ncbi:MAG TPA: acylphosphatase, partial [Ktedonobacteraceae bacterium]|nr:acylphosphatase [Ktedonobacteraceae bacterium]
MPPVTGSTIERRRIVIQGIVQGVGFRPFVYGQALQWGLVGFVLNDSGGVTIEVEGTSESLNGFQQALQENAPPLARIDSLITEEVSPCYDSAFVIAQSQAGAERNALISPDTATCDDCRNELFDPEGRRFHYPFINCTNCGPRFTIIQDVPYDRDKTTMGAKNRPIREADYSDDLQNQPPRLTNEDPIFAAARQLAAGAILAIKGLGGYHLACDA